MKAKPIGVLIVEDSLVVRRQLAALIEAEADMRVLGQATNGEEGVKAAEALTPDVITMDLQMPKLDGLGAIQRIMGGRSPRPIVVLTGRCEPDSPAGRAALQCGAVAVVAKSTPGASAEDQRQYQTRLLQQLRVASRVRVVRSAAPSGPAQQLAHLLPPPPWASSPTPASSTATTADAGDPPPPPLPGPPQLIAIGCSTGGPAALKSVFRGVRRKGAMPPVLIAQHLPGAFTRDLAKQLADALPLAAVEAADGDLPQPGTLYIAPGDRHLEFGADGRLHLSDAAPVNFCRPSVDVLFSSLAQHFHGRVLACVLTGMGNDGAVGALALKWGGATVLAQDEASSVVFAMPQAAAQAGAVDRLVSLDALARIFETIAEGSYITP